MLTVDVKINDALTKELESIKKELKQVPQDSLQKFKSLTPIRSGNARRRTTLKGDTIQANYPYAERLDEGYSKQAPKGMTEPFDKWYQDKIKKIMGK